MKRRKKRSKEEWAKWVARWDRSGQTARAFAEAHGLAVSSLYQWKHRLGDERAQRREKESGEEIRFVQVGAGKARGKASSVSEAGGADGGGSVEVVLVCGRVVRVREVVDVRLLRAVVEALESC